MSMFPKGLCSAPLFSLLHWSNTELQSCGSFLEFSKNTEDLLKLGHAGLPEVTRKDNVYLAKLADFVYGTTDEPHEGGEEEDDFYLSLFISLHSNKEDDTFTYSPTGRVIPCEQAAGFLIAALKWNGDLKAHHARFRTFINAIYVEHRILGGNYPPLCDVDRKYVDDLKATFVAFHQSDEFQEFRTQSFHFVKLPDTFFKSPLQQRVRYHD